MFGPLKTGLHEQMSSSLLSLPRNALVSLGDQFSTCDCALRQIQVTDIQETFGSLHSFM
jgi:hypothetical protein